ncbi:MAG: glycosyltransferase [Candidatus Nezhaarchaeales archaeon]
MLDVGIVSSYVPSLRTVGSDLEYAFKKMGYRARYFSYRVPVYDAIKLFRKAIVFMPFDPVYVAPWILLVRDYKRYSIRSVMYVTVEGIPKREMIPKWVRKDIIYIANSEFTKEMLEEVEIEVEDIIYHGINLEDIAKATPFKNRLKEELKAEVVFGTVCSSLPRKGLRKLWVIAGLVKDKLPKAKFFVMTDNRGAGIFEGMENVYVYPRFGKLSRTEVLSLIGSFDYYLCSSFAEGFGLPLLEAQALGVPVIAGKYKPLTEVTTPESTLYIPVQYVSYRDDGYGILFTYHEYSTDDALDVIKEAYEIYTSNPEEYKRMSEAGREFAKEFDILRTYSRFKNWLRLNGGKKEA